MTLRLFATATLLAALLALPPSGASAQPDFALNEIRIDQPGDDVDEYFELTGPASAGLDDVWLIVVGDGSGGSGTIEHVTDLSGQSTDASGRFTVGESSLSLGVPDMTEPLNFENGDNVTFLLVEQFTGSDGDDLDTNDDGSLESMPWTRVLDRVALITEDNPPDSTEYHYGPPTVGTDGEPVPSQVYRCPDGSGMFFRGEHDPAEGTDTPAESNDCCAGNDDCGDGDPCTMDTCSGPGGSCNHSEISGCCTSDDECSSGGACIETSCDTDRNECVSTPIEGCCSSSNDCLDGNPCTGDFCRGGSCENPPVDDCCVTNGDCDDGDPCTEDTCSGPGGGCLHEPVNNCCTSNDDCDDGVGCTTDTCNTETNRCEFTPEPGCCFDSADCHDGDRCTRDLCTEDHSCSNEPIEGCGEPVDAGTEPGTGGGGCTVSSGPGGLAGLLLGLLGLLGLRRRRRGGR
jgi:hypothetical protein